MTEVVPFPLNTKNVELESVNLHAVCVELC